MFKLHKAEVHYGPASYPLNGLEEFETLPSFEDLDVEKLTEVVGVCTGFPRQFKAAHHEKMVFTLEEHGFDLEIPEKIFAQADGYSITWVKA